MRGKPEKLETFNEGKNEIASNSGDENAVGPKFEKIPQFFPKTPSIEPGKRFFILNGEPLFQNYDFQNYPSSLNVGQQLGLDIYEQPHILPTKQELDLQYKTFPFRPLLLRNEIPKDAQGHFINFNQQPSLIIPNTQKQESNPKAQGQQAAQPPPPQVQQQTSQHAAPQIPPQTSQIPVQTPQQIPQHNFQFPEFNLQDIPLALQPQEFFTRHSNIPTQGQQFPNQLDTGLIQGQHIPSQGSPIASDEQQILTESRGFPPDSFFRFSLPSNFERGDQNFGQFAQFRFSPPSQTYYPIDDEDIENDSIIINANLDDAQSGVSSSNAENGGEWSNLVIVC